LNTKWEIEKDENVLYNQTAEVYQKILDSDCFTNEFGLIRNTFATNKEDILSHVVYRKGLTAGRNLGKFDRNDSEKQESARVIIKSLGEMAEWEAAIGYLDEVKRRRYANQKDLKSMLINIFRVSAQEEYLGLLKRKKKADRKVYEFKLKVEGNYEKYVLRKKWKKRLAWTALAMFVLIMGLGVMGYYVNEKELYLDSAKIEGERLVSVQNDIVSLLSAKEFDKAFNKTKNELVWMKHRSPFSGGDESNVKRLQLGQYE
jgi:hypothetical protein